MLRVICVRTGDKFDSWYEDNLKHMIDTHSNLDYDEFVVIRDENYDGVFNKLQMFDRYRDGQNIYFDLDTIITDDCNHLLRKDFTVCLAWWRKVYHTPLNSSIMSWEGDRSDIFELFDNDPEMFMMKYDKGMDQYLYENIKYKLYTEEDRYCSIQTIPDYNKDYSVYLFNQSHTMMLQPGWHCTYCTPAPKP
jgi:hypothetical protein